MNTTMKLGLAFSLVCAFVVGIAASVNAMAAVNPEIHTGASNATSLEGAPQSLTILMAPEVISAPKPVKAHKVAPIVAPRKVQAKQFVCDGRWTDLQGTTGQYRDCSWK